jgi:DNA-binding CsgD family transcriptional regulator
MIRNEQHWLSLADAFHSAAIDGEGWYAALEGLAEATGSQIGELIGVGSKATVPFNIMTNIDPAFQREFVAAGGGDPTINPRVGAGMKSPTLKVMADYDFITPEDYKRNPHYQEFARPWDIPFICLATLEKLDDGLIGLAVCRSKKDGYITPEQRAAFTSLAPHVRAAVRTQMTLENQGAALLTGAMEGLSLPAFVCDRAGRVKACTPAAEALVWEGRGLQLRQGQLQAGSPGTNKELQDAIDAAALGLVRPGAPLVRSVIICALHPQTAPIILEVIALPTRSLEFTFAPRVLIVIRGRNGSERRKTAILQRAFGLTAAEAEVAALVATGRSAEEIAAQRGVAVGTVRIQIKAAMAKTGVGRQAELAARIGQL